jgi:hypothetical protein
MAASAALNFGAPLLAYTLLRPHVASVVEALAIAAAIPVAVTLAKLAWRRRLDPVGVFSAISFALGVLVAWLSGGSPLAIELHEPVATGIIGLACLASVAVRRPLHLVVLRYLARTNPQAARIASDPESRRTGGVATVIIGATFLAHAAAITALALTEPAGTFLALQHPVGLPVFAVGLAALLWYRRRAPARIEPEPEP